MTSLTFLLGLALAFSTTVVLAVEPSCASDASAAIEDGMSLLQVNSNQHKAAMPSKGNHAEAPSIDDGKIVLSHELIIREGDMRLPTENEKKEFLKATNMYRCMHGASPLKWSDAVAEGANKYISPLTEMKHSKMYEVKPPAGPAAENLGKTSSPPTPAEQVARWGDEVANCGDGPPSSLKDGCAESVSAPCPVGHAKPDGSCHIGHFTALVWEGAETLGCAYSKSTSPQLIICRYKAGDTLTEETPNMNKKKGAYPQHVFPRTKTKAQCAGQSGSGSAQPVGKVVSAGSQTRGRTPVAQVVPGRSKSVSSASSATSCGKSATCEAGTKCGECKSKCGGAFSEWKCARTGSTFTVDTCKC